MESEARSWPDNSAQGYKRQCYWLRYCSSNQQDRICMRIALVDLGRWCRGREFAQQNRQGNSDQHCRYTDWVLVLFEQYCLDSNIQENTNQSCWLLPMFDNIHQLDRTYKSLKRYRQFDSNSNQMYTEGVIKHLINNSDQ